MKLLIIGSGGREHAIAWKISQNERVKQIFCAPGNAGTECEDKCVNVNIQGIDELLEFAEKENIDITIVGPEAPLVEGVVDKFKEKNLKIFGPSKQASQLEGSKIFSKNFMKKHGVKTAEYECFFDANKAISYLAKCTYPIVIKADGLAAGKGVVICEVYEEAKRCIEQFMINDIFKGSGKKIVIEEFLVGVEASILSICDGNTILPFISAKDHKQIFDGDKGPNTGGMGVISPNPYCNNKVLEEFKKEILIPTLKGIKEEKMDFIGIIFFGIMITTKGTYLLEYNIRMGDPETQAVLPLMESDFLELIESSLKQDLQNYDIKWKDSSSCCIMMASKGYPESYEKGKVININGLQDGKVFISGAKKEPTTGLLKTSGGRVLSIVSTGNNLDEARNRAYKNIKNIEFDGGYYRKDIGIIRTEV